MKGFYTFITAPITNIDTKKKAMIFFDNIIERDPGFIVVREATSMGIEYYYGSIANFDNEVFGLQGLEEIIGYTWIGEEVGQIELGVQIDEKTSQLQKYITEYLSAEEQYIFKSYHGIGSTLPKSITMIGNELGLSKDRVSQIKEKCFRLLRNTIKEQSIKDYLVSIKEKKITIERTKVGRKNRKKGR